MKDSMNRKSISMSHESSSSPLTRQRQHWYAMYVFWILFAIGFLNYLDRNVLTGAANTIAHAFGLGIDSVGYLASAFLVVYTVATIPLGLWADRALRKNVVAVSVVVWSIATALTALTFNFFSLFLSRMLLGIGEAGYFPAGTALLSDYFTPEKRSRIMSWWSVGQMIGIFFGFVIGGVLANWFVGSWRLAFLFTGIPGLGLAFLSWRLREPRRNEADEAEHQTPDGPTTTSPLLLSGTSSLLSQVNQLLHIKTLIVLTIMQAFAFFVMGVTVVFLPTFLQQKDLYGLSSGIAGIFSGCVIVVAGSIGIIGGGYLADLLNRRYASARVLVCGIGFLLSAPMFALAITTHNFVFFSILLAGTTALITLYTGPCTAATQDVAPSVLHASAVAVTLVFAHTLGDAFAPTLVGMLARHFDPTGGLHFTQNIAGHDLARAMLVTCTPALALAGIVGIVGARWMQVDAEAAKRADHLAYQTLSTDG